MLTFSPYTSRRSLRIRQLTGLAATSLALATVASSRAQEGTNDEGFVSIPAPRVTSLRASQYFLRQNGPARDGKKTKPYRWAAGSNAAADLPRSSLDWSTVAAFRFWLYIDQPRDSFITLVITSKTSGYVSANVPINFQGWKQITVPIENFRSAKPFDLSKMTSIGFRAQGYGQKPLDPTTIWFVDDAEVQLKPEATPAKKRFALLRRQASIGVNNWKAQGNGTNPILAAIYDQYSDPQPAFQPDATGNWAYRDQAEALVPLAFAVADDRSPLKGRADLVKNFIARVDTLLAASTDGDWRTKKTDDPNINRFTIMPLLDGVLQFRTLPEGQAAWARWQGPLRAAVDFQKRDYGLNDPSAGKYVNQDVYYALTMAIAGKLWNRDDDSQIARNLVKQIQGNLLPDGGFHYIGQENESPLYHNLNISILGRYLTLTGDPVARETIEKTANYWPLTLSAQGQPEYWSDVWWKQSWADVEREALIISATVTGDPRTKYLLNQVLQRTSAPAATMRTVYAAPYWRAPDQGGQQPLPPTFLLPDRNIRGVHGRNGNFYYGLTRGRGLRDTFAGGMVSVPGDQPLDSAIRFVHFDILSDAAAPHGLWLSQINDRSGLAVKQGSAAGLGVTYSPQKSIINLLPTPSTPDTGWKVTQIWRAEGSGLVGHLVLEANRALPAQTVVARIGLGPSPLEKQADGSWKCGDMHIVPLQSFGVATATTMAAFNMDAASAWPALEFRQNVEGGRVDAGARYSFAVWIGPDSATPPTGWQALPNETGWVAKRAGGGSFGVLFNPNNSPAGVKVPWQGAFKVTRNMQVSQTVGQGRVGSVVRLQPSAAVLIDTD